MMRFQNLPHDVRRLLIVGVLAAGLVVLRLGSLSMYFHNTPACEGYLRKCPVRLELAAARWSAAHVFPSEPTWRQGDVDPIALPADDAVLRVHTLSVVSTLRHGNELFADVLQEFAVAADRQSADRVGLAVRTTILRVHSDMRAQARPWNWM